MLRLILIIVLFLLSLLTVVRAPTSLLWYASILVTEFCWIFFTVVLVLLLSGFGGNRFATVTFLIGIVSLVLYSIPVVGAFRISGSIRASFAKMPKRQQTKEDPPTPFGLVKMFSGINAKKVSYQTITYDVANKLTLDFYPSVMAGNKPCVVIVHGGSWAGGDSQQLPELNSVLAKAGYHVATINYRLAPKNIYPAPVEDVKTAIAFLRANAANLSIDTNNFALLGRSAGGQIVLSAAYTLNDASIKGVISFYGPADMVWGYANPTNPLVLNSRKVMEDYLGGTYSEVPQQYINSSATETIRPVPTLLIHGENDPLVSHIHGIRLGKKLDSLGIKYYSLYLPWATHGFDYTLNGPAGQVSTWSVLRFLEGTFTRD